MKDILCPNLTGDTRLHPANPEMRRVFHSDLYEVFFCHYSGLVTALIHYKKEGLRIMTRLSDDAGDHWAQKAILQLQTEGRSPLHLLRDAKLECQLQLTLHDRAQLKLAGIEVPRSAGRYREMFKENDR